MRNFPLHFQPFHTLHCEHERSEKEDEAHGDRETERKFGGKTDLDLRRHVAQIGQGDESDEDADVEEADDETQRAAEAAHNLARIVFLEIGEDGAEAYG